MRDGFWEGFIVHGLALSLEELNGFLMEEFPQIGLGRAFAIEGVGPMRAQLRLFNSPRNLRPGGTVSGPAIFALADVALYCAILAQVGRVKLAVTTNLNINFMRKAADCDLIGEAILHKLGRSLAVGEVRIFAAGQREMIAHASGTYSIPAVAKT